MPEEFRAMYDPSDMELPPNFLTQHPHDTGALAVRDETLAAIPRDPDEIRRHIAEYYGIISHLDHQFGRVMDTLKAQGLDKDTIVIFAGDNGLAVGQHGLMGKQCLYDHSVRVPLIFSGPGIPAGGKRDALVYLLDIYPTLCDLAGIDTPASVEGGSLAPCLSGKTETMRESLYLAYADTIRGVTDGKHKLIEYAAGGVRATQFFDLERDPFETCDLSAEPSVREELTRLRREMFRLRDEWDDAEHEVGAEYWEKYNV
jgi:arylsulfatase A-like enzyme